MTGERFDNSRSGPESWPYLFGNHLDRIGAGIGSSIVNMAPQVHFLARLASIHFTPEEEADAEELERAGNDEDSLKALLAMSIKAAHRGKTWLFRDETPTDTEDALTLLEERRKLVA